MLLHILKNDLKRKKIMNVILFLFIILATTFVSSGINNVVTVMNGTEYFLDKANIGDYIMLTVGEDPNYNLDEILEKMRTVQRYRKDSVVFAMDGNFWTEDGSVLGSGTSVFLQSIQIDGMRFFDSENEQITDVEEGHIYMPVKFMDANGLEPGDVLQFEQNGVELTLVLDGVVKDALMGSENVGNARFILSQEDMEKLLNDKTSSNSHQEAIYYIDTDDIQGIVNATAAMTNIKMSSTRFTFVMTYVMEMIAAILMMILSVCLVIVSFVVLKFSISFTMKEEFREIGVMKAIGLSNTRIRGLYVVKYLGLALAGSFLGFFASIPFGKLLLDSVSRKMVLGNSSGLYSNLLGAGLVVWVIVLFAYTCTRRVKRATPMDAIRSGQTGERYKSKSALRISKCPAGNGMFLAANDVLSSPKRFVTIILSFAICTLFVLMLENTIATTESPDMVYTVGTKSDLYVTDFTDIVEEIRGKDKEFFHDKLDQMADRLTEEGMPAELCMEIYYQYPVTFRNNKYSLTCRQGVNTESTDYTYLEGSAPQSPKEIAITRQISEETGAKIGDTMTISFGEEEIECMVTGYFQTFSMMGKVVLLHEAAPTNPGDLNSTQAFQIDFTDKPTEKEIERRKERIKELYGTDDVYNITEYCNEFMGVRDTLEYVQLLFIGVMLVVVILITILMERSFIEDERSQIALLKAIGFQNRQIIRWHVYRFTLVAVIAGFLAAVLSIPMTKLCISPIFAMMGAGDIRLHMNWFQIFVFYPGLIAATTMVVAWLTALHTKTIKSSETANIE